MGPQADWSVVDALMLKTLAAAEKGARYRHTQLSPVPLAGDINAKVDIGELLENIKSEWTKLWPLIDLKVAREPQRSRTGGRYVPPLFEFASAHVWPSSASRSAPMSSRCPVRRSMPWPCAAISASTWRATAERVTSARRFGQDLQAQATRPVLGKGGAQHLRA